MAGWGLGELVMRPGSVREQNMTRKQEMGGLVNMETHLG